MTTDYRLTLLASMLVTLVLGSVHAFSVFIAPLERLLLLPRSEVSLIYSLALVALTLAVLLGYRVYHLLAPAWLVLTSTTRIFANRLFKSFAILFSYYKIYLLPDPQRPGC